MEYSREKELKIFQNEEGEFFDSFTARIISIIKKGRLPNTPETKAIVRKMRFAGYSPEQIAETFNVKLSYVKKVFCKELLHPERIMMGFAVEMLLSKAKRGNVKAIIYLLEKLGWNPIAETILEGSATKSKEEIENQLRSYGIDLKVLNL